MSDPAFQGGQSPSPWGSVPGVVFENGVRTSPPTSDSSAASYSMDHLQEPDPKRRRGEWEGDWSSGGADAVGSPMEI
ncbi:hypothetical protein BGZ58_005481, partial [Dissophora ornata]